jgi:hypothetical protein
MAERTTKSEEKSDVAPPGKRGLTRRVAYGPLGTIIHIVALGASLLAAGLGSIRSAQDLERALFALAIALSALLLILLFSLLLLYLERKTRSSREFRKKLRDLYRTHVFEMLGSVDIRSKESQ